MTHRMPSLLRRRVVAVAATLVVLAIAAGCWLAISPSADMVHASARFARSTALYKGSTVRILGVAVGKVTSIKPLGDSVEVDFDYPAKYKVPASADAVIVPPSIVGDRYLQLTPAYTGGPVLADGATIPLSRTAVPLEYDDILAALNKLDVALGPGGANRTGSLSNLVKVGAANLAGNGRQLHDTLDQFASLLETLDGSRSDLVGVIDNLQRFTGALAKDDSGVRAVNNQLAQVATFLSDERGDLDAALRNLTTALGEVATFVHQNKDVLTSNVKGLASVTSVLTRNQRALTEFLDEAPLALMNLKETYDPVHHTLDTRANFDQLSNPGAEICQLLAAVGLSCPDQLKHLPTPPTSGGNPPSSLSGLLGVRR